MKYLLIAAICISVVVAKAREPKLINETLTTNYWELALDEYNKGLHEYSVWGANIIYYSGSYGSFTTTNVFDYDYAFRCGREHLDEYPKQFKYILGVQWKREYEQKIKVGKDKITIKLLRFLYPHKKLTIGTNIKLKKIVTVTTNVTDIVQKKKCKHNNECCEHKN